MLRFISTTLDFDRILLDRGSELIDRISFLVNKPERNNNTSDDSNLDKSGMGFVTGLFDLGFGREK